MKADKFISLLREVIRTELRLVLHEELNSLNTKSIDTPKVLKPEVRKPQIKTPPVVQEFSKNSILNSILNETAQSMTPIPEDFETGVRYSEQPTLSSNDFHPKKINALPDDLREKGVTVEDLPESVQNALTKDYSLLMKKIKEKKGR